MQSHSLALPSSRYQFSRTGTRCCALIPTKPGSAIACLIWAGLSAYFAALAFTQISPFYSHLDATLLTASGVVNIYFAVISLIIFFVTVLKSRWSAHRFTAYIVGISTLCVLADTLLNFVMFVNNKNDFMTWCTNSSSSTMSSAISSTSPSSEQSLTYDLYNCQRLYNDEVKWGLLSVVVIFVFYVHFTIVVASAVGTNFFTLGLPTSVATPIAPIPPVQTLANLSSTTLTDKFLKAKKSKFDANQIV